MANDNEIIIKAKKGWIPVNFREIWQFRGLLYFLAWRDVKVKYKQSLLGVAWVMFRPVITMLIFSVLFGRLAKIPSEGVPYPIFVFLGLLPWTYFSTAVNASTLSLVGSSNLVSKVYFPRLIIPVSANLSNLLDFFVSMLVLIIMMLYYKIIPQAGIIFAPVIILTVFMTAVGVGTFLTALNVRYRDIGQIIPFIVQIWMFITPVIYPVSFLPEKYRVLIYLNPVAGPIEAFRASILGHMPINTQGLLISLIVSLIVFVSGLYYFKMVERTFADII